MPPASPDVSIPGAASDAAASQAQTGEAQGADLAEIVAEKDAEIARLRGLITKGAAGPSELRVEEGGGARTAQYKAESKHMEYTTAELDQLVRAGKVSLTEHHVLCKDGWYVNPNANAHANG